MRFNYNGTLLEVGFKTYICPSGRWRGYQPFIVENGETIELPIHCASKPSGEILADMFLTEQMKKQTSDKSLPPIPVSGLMHDEIYRGYELGVFKTNLFLFRGITAYGVESFKTERFYSVTAAMREARGWIDGKILNETASRQPA